MCMSRPAACLSAGDMCDAVARVSSATLPKPCPPGASTLLLDGPALRYCTVSERVTVTRLELRTSPFMQAVAEDVKRIGACSRRMTHNLDAHPDTAGILDSLTSLGLCREKRSA